MSRKNVTAALAEQNAKRSFYRGRVVDSDDSSSIPFNCRPFKREEPDDYALPSKASTQDTEEEGWEDICNCCGSLEESWGGCEEFILPPNDSKQNTWTRQIFKKKSSSGRTKFKAAPPRKNFRRVVYRRRFFRRERVDVETGEKQVMLRPKSSKASQKHPTTFGWIPKKPPVKRTGRALGKKLSRCIQAPVVAVSFLLIAPIAAILTSKPLKSKFKYLTKRFSNNVETGTNEADEQVSSKSKLRFWLPTKKQKIPDEEITSAGHVAAPVLLGNEVEVSYDGSKNIISMPIQEPSSGSRRQPFGDEVEVDYDGAKNTISVPIKKSYHETP